MVKTLEQINQEFYIQWYLAGREIPQAPVWVEPPSIQTIEQDEVERWMRELVNSPDLDSAAELLDELPLPSFTVPAGRGEDKQLSTEFQRPHEVLWSDPAASAAERKSGLWKSISNIVFYAALVAIVVGAFVLGNKNNGSSRFFGFQYFEVLSGSMQSMIPQGSLVITKQVPSGEIRAGDVITFLRSDEETVTHQVIEVVANYNGAGTPGFRTKGTDNPDPDPDIVDARNVIGVMQTHIAGLGFTLRYISENLKYVFLAFVLVILISIAVRVLLGDGRNSRVQQPDEGCGHITSGRKKSRPKERTEALCKRQTRAA